MRQLIGVSRPKFLTLTLICIWVAYAISHARGAQVAALDLLLVTVLGLAGHISVNAFNEYFDFKSGLDLNTTPTPFSGGSGTLVKAPSLANAALTMAVTSLLLTIASGLWLAWMHGWALLIPGIIGVLVIFTYTQYLNRSPWLCLIAPGVGFGLCMTLGAAWVFNGQLTAAAWVMAIVMALLVINLLLLNQFPDIYADQQVGRRHFPIAYGVSASAKLFVLFHLAAFLLVPLAVFTEWLSAGALLGLPAIILLGPLLRGVLKQPARVESDHRLLGLNVAFVHLFPLLSAVGIWLVN